MPTFELSVVTPERTTYEGTAAYLDLPAWEGSLGVLPGHAPALVLLQEGVARVKDVSGQEWLLALSGGFAEIDQKKVTLFAETAELAAEINEERARLAQERAKEDIQKSRRREKGSEDIDIGKAQTALKRSLVRLKVSELRRRKGYAGMPRPGAGES
ncbi:MAG: ATP synthase F1 subunit epsilon [Elusimicrobia bacterium]|nr:ATP synthase F1 subunit epsilon [Elusimicrobiota bacterium]